MDLRSFVIAMNGTAISLDNFLKSTDYEKDTFLPHSISSGSFLSGRFVDGSY